MKSLEENMVLIRNADLRTAGNTGRRDILVASGTILAIEPSISAGGLPAPVQIMDADGMLAIPGLVDAHVHIIGGGGEGGYHTRTPELDFGETLLAGVTTVIGTLGTDGVARSMEALVAKAYALRNLGMSAWVYAGSYRIPGATVTGDLMKDIMMIDPVIGAGEVAISDHRSSRPSLDELGRIVAEARVGGLLSGKAGIVNFHLGDAPAGLQPLHELAQAKDLPLTQFYPTHCNRNPELFKESVEWARSGGWIDFTTSTVQAFLDQGEVSVEKALQVCRDEGVLDRVTMTSDGQGSLPLFSPAGILEGMTIGTCSSLWESVRGAILNGTVGFDAGVATVTSTPARVLGLRSKGRLATGMDADLVLLDPDSLAIRSVVAKGQLAVDKGRLLMKGPFERS